MIEEKAIELFYKSLIKRKLNHKTTKGYINQIRLFLDWLKQVQLTYLSIEYAHVLEYVKYCKASSNSSRTINRKIAHIKAFYDLLIKHDLVEFNPANGIQLRGIQHKSPKQLLSTQELNFLYEQFDDYNLAGKRNKEMLGLMVYQALSTKELHLLKVEDVDLNNGVVHVPALKRSNERTLKLTPQQILPMQYYIQQVRTAILNYCCKTSDYLFVSVGEGKTLGNVYSRITDKVKILNNQVEKLSDIRTSVIMQWLKEYNIREVQYRIGHKYVSSTSRYQTKDMEELQGQLEQIHPLNHF